MVERSIFRTFKRSERVRQRQKDIYIYIYIEREREREGERERERERGREREREGERESAREKHPAATSEPHFLRERVLYCRPSDPNPLDHRDD